MRQHGIKFTVAAPNIDEVTLKKKPSAIVTDLALQKGLAAANNYPDNPVLSADTIVYCKGQILGKPKDVKDAYRLLSLENNSWQSVYTGVALIWKAKNIKLHGYAVSKCKARKLTEEQLWELAAKHLDKAGGYAVQDKDDILIERIEGDFDNVMGMPMRLVKKLLKKIT